MNKIALLTGGTSGIGLETAKHLIKEQYTLILTYRTLAKAETVKSQLLEIDAQANIDLVECDLNSLQSCKTAGEYIQTNYPVIDLQLNNAGVAATTYELTEDGVESSFASNHLGHFVLTQYSLPGLKAAPKARLINTTSKIHFFGSRKILEDYTYKKRIYFVLRAYADAKLATTLFTFKLADLLADTNVTVNCVHPGDVATDIWPSKLWVSRVFWKFVKEKTMLTTEQGAAPLIHLATSSSVDSLTGKYFSRETTSQASKSAYDQQLQNDLWELSERLGKDFLPKSS